MKVFLYGKRHSGKTTIINRLLEELKLDPSGFRTISGSPDAEGDWNIYITGAGKDSGPRYKAACCHKDGSWESYADVFDSAGERLLRFSAAPRIVLMDELGFMEAKALKFQQRVLEILDEDYPVLGVVKPKSNDFLRRIIDYPGVVTVEVNEENRGDVLKFLKDKYRYLE